MFSFKYGTEPVKIWDTREFELRIVPGSEAPADATLDEAARAAAELLEAAQVEAAAIRDEAARDGYRQGQAEGWEAGYREGRAAAEAEAGSELARQLEAVDALRAIVREQMVNEAKAAVLAVAERFAGHLEEGERDRIAGWTHEMLIEAAPHVASVIEVHPGDVGAVLAARGAWEDIHPAPLTIRVVPNPNLRRGECRLLTDAGWLERSLEADDDLRQIVEAWARTAMAATWDSGVEREAEVDQRV